MSRIYRISLAFAILAILTESQFAQGKKDKAPGNIDAYSISATAVKGQSTTDLCVAIQTTDAIDYPIPGSLKKLQVKILNEEGDVVFIKNLSAVHVTDGKVCMTVPELQALMPVEVQVHIKTAKTVDEEVLRAKTRVLLRPDLIVNMVQAPAQVAPNAPFNIEAVIREVNLHLGATANVSLWEGETVLATATGIVVGAGSQVSVLFQGVNFAELGTHDLTIKISDAVPDEYNTENNGYSFSVVVADVQPASYYLEYYLYKNYHSTFSYYDCGWGFNQTFDGSYGQWSYYASIPYAPTNPIDSVKFEALSANGTLSKIYLYGLTPYTSDGNYTYYALYYSDPDGSNAYGTLYVDEVNSTASLYIYMNSGDYFYVTNYSDGSTYVYEQHGQQMNLEDFLEVRMLVADGGQQAGGGATVEVTATQPISGSYGYNDGGCYYYSSDYSYDYSYNYSSGTTDPAFLPSGNRGNKLPSLADGVLPLNTDLVQNYPNPFNPSTNIQFTIEHSGPAVLKVYDMLGKEVAELFQGEGVEGRTYNFTFQAGNLASGMYYAKLEAGGKQYVKKMLLMK